MKHILINYLALFGYGIVGAITMAVAFGIIIKVWDLITPVDEWEEIKKGNIAVAIVTAAVILGVSLVVCFAILPS
ncbi:MAG: hypothetical protein A2283_06085 [Lentisphaerae bacterium RIFOXYA12_FULL_48_11]|nr:MAG: hypothetical protein A2283_06085 [Lentisphaerae bacterium RIFOXYA12_FULL_48_11]